MSYSMLKRVIPGAPSVSCLAVALTLAMVSAHGQADPDFVVAPGGNDAGEGTADRPFATLERARSAVRQQHGEFAQRGREVVVQLQDGMYALDRPFVLAPEDSGTETSPVVYRAAPGTRPILSGGRRLAGWREVSPGRWEVTVTGLDLRKQRPTQLFVNNQRRLRPTVPRDGYFFIEVAVAGTKSGRQDRFRYREGQIDPDWQSIGDIEFMAFHKWSTSRIPLESADPDTRVATLAGGTWHGQHAELSSEVWYRLDNVREALDEPGEWYLDRARSVLTYLAKPGENPNADEVILPILPRLVDLRGDVDKGTFVEHVRFEGLTMAHAAWHTPDQGHSVYQAEVTMDGAVNAVNARHVVFQNCIVRHVGNCAIVFGGGCSNCRVDTCELFDLGGGGVKIGTGRFNEEPDKRKWADQCEVRNSLVAYAGRLHPASVGLWIGHAHHNVLEHNHVFDLYYSPVSVGWRWAQGESPAHHNTVAWNHLHRAGQDVMSDMGGIYTLGESPGTQLHHNHIHDISRARYGGWGIYHDESSADTVSEFNIVRDTEDACFHLHHGRRLLLRNNVFANGRNEQMKLSNLKKSGTLTLERNIWIWSDAPLHAGKLDDQITFTGNIYFRTDGEPIVFPDGKTPEEWRERETGSVVVDPQFTMSSAGTPEFTDRWNAKEYGIEPFSLRTAGRVAQTDVTAALARPPSTFPPAPDPPPPSTHQDFELLEVGQRMPGWGLLAASREENAAVTDETAANGAKCLKFRDGPGGAVYFPHLYRDTKYEKGTFRVAFSLRVDQGARMQFECRDSTPWYTAGPGIDVAPDGTLKSGGRDLGKINHGEWVHVDMTCAVGPNRTGTYRLTLTRADGSKQGFPDIPLRDGFETMGWMGFASNSKERVVYYVDDFVLEPGQPE